MLLYISHVGIHCSCTVGVKGRGSWGWSPQEFLCYQYIATKYSLVYFDNKIRMSFLCTYRPSQNLEFGIEIWYLGKRCLHPHCTPYSQTCVQSPSKRNRKSDHHVQVAFPNSFYNIFLEGNTMLGHYSWVTFILIERWPLKTCLTVQYMCGSAA